MRHLTAPQPVHSVCVMAHTGRFWSKVDKSAGPAACWPWTAYKTPSGYGQFQVGKRPMRANRVACELAHGPPPEGAYALHSCDNRACVNPAHLRWGTCADNAADKVARGRSSQNRGGRNGRAKLSAFAVDLIRSSALPQEKLAALFGVHQAQVSRICAGKAWT